jgi:hypothetical protein
MQDIIETNINNIFNDTFHQPLNGENVENYLQNVIENDTNMYLDYNKIKHIRLYLLFMRDIYKSDRLIISELDANNFNEIIKHIKLSDEFKKQCNILCMMHCEVTNNNNIINFLRMSQKMYIRKLFAIYLYLYYPNYIQYINNDNIVTQSNSIFGFDKLVSSPISEQNITHSIRRN